MLGGTLGANPNLAGRTASTIVNQVTTTGPASTLLGPLEVFGNPATVIVSNPNGVSVNGLSLTNAPGLVLTTGAVQFLTGVGGTSASFTNAGALAYNVTSGNITINGPAGVNGPGSGIEGTVGNIDVIGQTIKINAPLRADQQVNLIAGNQFVSPSTSTASGTTYSTASNGLVNTAAAIGNGAIAIDANQYGSVTSGQVFIVSTAAGMGVNAQGALEATVGNVGVNSNGDITVGSTFANQNVSLASVGNTTIAGTGLANQNYTVAANGDIDATGSVSAGQNATLAADGDLNANSVAATGSAKLTAGNSMSVGSLSGHDLDVEATKGDLTLGQSIIAPGTIKAIAGRDLKVNGAVQSGSTVALTGGQKATVNGSVSGVGDVSLVAQKGMASTTGTVATNGQLTVTGQHGVSLGGTTSAQGNATLTSGAGDVKVGGALSTPGQIAMTAGQDASVAGAAHSGQSATITAGRDAVLSGGLEVDGTGDATVRAGRDLTGGGTVNVANDTTLTAARNLSVSGAIRTGNNLSASATQNLSVGATTAVGTETLTATNGSATLNGAAVSGADMKVTAGTDVTANGSILSLGNLNVDAQSGNLSANSTLESAGNATLNAGQTLTLKGLTTVTKDATLTGTNITTQGMSVGGNLGATATGNLDTSAAQSGKPFDANAPALSVNGNATLKGANVTTGNALVSGTTRITGTQSLKTGGTAAYKGDATFTGGTVTNTGRQMAVGNLTVTGSNVTNQGTLSSLKTTTVNAANLSNSGSIYGPTNNLNVTGSTTNSGGLLAVNTLALTTQSLDNSNGLIFAGDVNNPASPVGDATVNVNGGNGTFTNTNGQILAQHVLAVNLPNQAFDPSAASAGTLNGGSAFNLSVQSINNSGVWTLPGTTVTVTATQGIANAGTINQGAGTLTLNGAVSNSGTVTANDLTINGSLSNLAKATMQANDAFTLNGSGTNAGTVEAINTLSISGSSYDNSNGVTKAGNSSSQPGQGNASINLSGDLGNAGGTLTATNDLSITANNVNNGVLSASVAPTTTTKDISNVPLLMSLVVGSDTLDFAYLEGAENGFCCAVDQTPQQVTLADALSPTGIGQTPLWSGMSYRLVGSQPVTTSGSVTFVQIGGQWFVQTPQNAGTGTATKTVALPVATETTTTTGSQSSSAPSVIAAGHNLNLKADSLNNQGGTVNAANDANINVQSLSNGGSSYTSTVTDSIDVASINTFLSQAPSTIQMWDNLYGPNALGPYSQGYYIDPAGIKLSAPGTVTPLSTSSSVTVQGSTGQIVAGHDLNLSGGNLTNAGTLAAANDVNITAASFTNQGTNTGTKTVTAGCASGVSNPGCSNLSTTNPNSETYSYQQTNSTVTAGHNIVIAVGTVNNTYGNLVAKNNVVIGGAGTTATNTTQASNVTNTSGAIEAGNDVSINAATVVNTIAAPAQVHENYGSAALFTGCTTNCEAYVDVQSANPSTITANHDVNVQAGSFSNTGSLVTALNNVTINASGSASNSNQYLNAYWSSGFDHFGKQYASWGCADNPSLCQTLYGSAYSSSASQDPAGLPSGVGLPDFVPGTIQAGSTAVVNAPTLANTGNITSNTVNLTGTTLVNGLANPNVYTPPPAVSGQVISLGPPAVPAGATTSINGAGLVTTLNGKPTSVTGAAGLPSNTPIGVQTVGKPVAPQVQTVASGTASSPSYLINNPASLVMGDLSPAALLAKLPASLQPGSTQFYYDPYTENQQIEQAALQATGKNSFYSTTSATDNISQASIGNQDKAALYGAALQYAEQNNIALGTQLSQAQLAQINAPMLWYVEQTVPEPGCTATGNGACPTVQALMPEVLLPQNYAQVNADGEITGTNVTLNYANSILNTGSISAQNLTVNTASLTNEQRSTNIGTIYQEVDSGVAKTTGTVVQQGGFMSAMNYDMNAQAINDIGGTIQKLAADGTVDQAATAQMLAGLKDQLGSNFTQSTVSNNLHTDVISDGGMGPIMIVQAVISVAVSIVASPILGAALSSLMNQADSGQFSLTSLGEAVAVAWLTQGIDQGLGLDKFNTLGANLVSSDASVTLANLGNTALQIGEQSLVNAGISTAIQGGSFLTALKNNVITDLAAVGANAIGAAGQNPDSILAQGSIGYDLAHAALGCAAGAAEGTGCGGGAVGGAISAGLNPVIDANGNMPPAVLAAIETLVSGGVASGLGLNAQGAMTSAQNETLNNYLNDRQANKMLADLRACAPGDMQCVSNVVAAYKGTSDTQQSLAKNCNTIESCNATKNDAASAIGVSDEDITTLCQGGTYCTQFLDSLSNQGVNAKASATMRWNDVSTAVYAQNAIQSLISSGFSQDQAALWSALSPLDMSGAVTGLLGSMQAAFQRGLQFQNTVLTALGLPANTTRLNVTLSDGTPATVIPDALPNSTIVEIKDVRNISNSNQFRGYAASGNAIQLIVSPNTQTISQPLRDLVTASGGSIKVFDPSTNTLSAWQPR